MSSFKKLELDFLWEISGTLASGSDEKCLSEELKKIFEKYLNINDLKIYIFEESSGTLRDFIKSWIMLDSSANSRLLNIYNDLKKENKKVFSLNKKLLSYDLKLEDLENTFSENLIPENNTLYFPVKNENKMVGLIELSFDEIINEVKKSDFLISLGIAASQISGAVTNRILNNKMVINLNFQNVMKNIAKIIETQYDLTYILPIIGEMVDKFISAHLIYIFMKDKDGVFKLVWPLSCKDKRISELLNSYDESKSCMIDTDSKRAVWAIKNEEEVIGAIVAGSGQDKLTNEELKYLTHLTRQASITIGHADSYSQILQYATLDALTGLNNRRQFEVRLNQEFATAKRKHKPLCCIMLDIDFFKKVNDTYGHAAGDCVLKSTAKIIAKELREYDIASRYGGEEFCILLPYTTLKEAEHVAQRLRVAVEKAKINISDEDVLQVTISVGVSTFSESMQTPNALYESADAALYDAKRNGRNRVVVNQDCL